MAEVLSRDQLFHRLRSLVSLSPAMLVEALNIRMLCEPAFKAMIAVVKGLV